jgi:hypothetical protein
MARSGTSLHVATACSGAEGIPLHVKHREAALSCRAGQGWYVPGRDGPDQTHGDRPCGREKIALRPRPGPLSTCSAVAPDESRRRLASLIPPAGGFNPASRRRCSGACSGAQAHYRPGRSRPRPRRTLTNSLPSDSQWTSRACGSSVTEANFAGVGHCCFLRGGCCAGSSGPPIPERRLIFAAMCCKVLQGAARCCENEISYSTLQHVDPKGPARMLMKTVGAAVVAAAAAAATAAAAAVVVVASAEPSLCSQRCTRLETDIR